MFFRNSRKLKQLEEKMKSLQYEVDAAQKAILSRFQSADESIESLNDRYDSYYASIYKEMTEWKTALDTTQFLSKTDFNNYALHLDTILSDVKTNIHTEMNEKFNQALTLFRNDIATTFEELISKMEKSGVFSQNDIDNLNPILETIDHEKFTLIGSPSSIVLVPKLQDKIIYIILKPINTGSYAIEFSYTTGEHNSQEITTLEELQEELKRIVTNEY